MGKWAEAEVWVNLTSGQSVPGIGKTIRDTYWFEAWTPVWAFVESVTVIDDNENEYRLEVNTTDSYSPYGWCIFDRIDAKVAPAEYTEGTSENEGEIDVVVDPIDPDDAPDFDPAKFELRDSSGKNPGWRNRDGDHYLARGIRPVDVYPQRLPRPDD